MRQATTAPLPATAAPAGSPPGSHAAEATVFAILGAISLSHFLNDLIQSLIASIYPMLKTSLHLNFAQIGLITLTFQACASLLQPFFGAITDRRPITYALPIGMSFTLCGLLLLSQANFFVAVLVAAGLVGLGSSVFHPEASRVARLASGGRLGLAQSLFQVGGNAGTSAGPLLAAFIVMPYGQHAIAWFSLVALVAIIVMIRISRWYAENRTAPRRTAAAMPMPHGLTPRRVTLSIGVLLVLMLSKFLYISSISSYLIFYLTARFGITVRSAQFVLFAYLASMAVGTLVGGPIGDRIGRKYVIWGSILGILPFTLALPHVGLTTTVVLVVIIGLVLSSAFSAIIVYATELVPGKVGTIAGLFFGLAFGISGIGAAALGVLADHTSISFVYGVCAFLPALGLATVLLPNLEPRRRGK